MCWEKCYDVFAKDIVTYMKLAIAYFSSYLTMSDCGLYGIDNNYFISMNIVGPSLIVFLSII